MPTQQKALFLLEPHGSFTVKDTSVPEPGPHEVLVEVHAAGLNPLDWKIQVYNVFVSEYPAIIGSDAAGIVKKVGDGVTSVSIGDRVMHSGALTNARGTFQQYTIVPDDIVAKVPENITLDQAATIPAAAGTAVLAFYNQPGTPLGGLGLTAPWDGGRGKYAGEPIVIVGGSSAVGQYAIQLAVVGGFSPIIASASLRNEAHLKSLGATHIVDRNAHLASAVKAITPKPVKYVFDAIALKDTQEAAYESLAPGGILLTTLEVELDRSKLSSDKRVTMVYGEVHAPVQRALGQTFYKYFTEMVATGELKPNNVQVLPSGLAGVPAGHERLKGNKVSAVKLIAHPQDTL
ncbi:hypothetical protein PHLGIDRAFT_31427 [Phlebiopsis gigantea 11061_1 CR5-6]|uniref:Enoyl reductase (ER) domain-containing protein n=1 Tax=Phlebiopsis gigantea (strain 11061_1 CR5-6) TaxID=745531 RepID=A0A0C3S6Q8_PHLG1|nr:hypothetical protein PHLGIDRAFT_31427 [Phlebiopsis gigantea 11061_1 CR5-6]